MPPAQLPDPLFLALQGAIAGRYSLERELGRGGMGIVYLARDVRLDRPVAIKLLPPERARVETLRARFLREARMAARLAHPNVVPIHAVEEIGDFVFYAMRYVDGETLGDRLRRMGPVPPGETARILRDVAFALAYAHAQGVIHRDIKPDNILLETDGRRALVTDFGIARLLDHEEVSGGRVVGTPEYLAPEQAAGEAGDARSDLYALGAVGYHCLTGSPPFTGDVPQLLAQHLTRPATPLREILPSLPPALAGTLDAALAKDPDERPATAEEMAEAIAPRAVATTELPVPVRIWVERGRELKGIYIIWSLFFYGLGTLIYVGNMAGQGHVELSSMIAIALCGLSGMSPWAAHLLWRISETRRALEDGVTLEDLRVGLDVALEKREEELRYEATRQPHPLAKVARAFTYTAFTGVIATLVTGVFVRGTHEGLLFGLFALSTMATVGGGLFGLIFPGRRIRTRDAFARLRQKMWRGTFGSVMTRIASFGLRTGADRAWAAWRPTETALGSATETLFAALPEASRALFADLPDVVGRLEREAQIAREHLDRGESGVWGTRLERAVAAIETLRVGLLRVAAGEDQRGALTADLDAARELSLRIDYLVAARDEVTAFLGQSTPASDQSSTQALPSTRAPTTSLG